MGKEQETVEKYKTNKLSHKYKLNKIAEVILWL